MSVTTTKTRSLKDVLNEANPNEIADALRKVQVGNMVVPLKRAFTGLTAATSFDLTLIDGTGETPTGVGNANRLAALSVITLRCTASSTANSVGSYVCSDAGGTAVSPTAGANVGIALLSDSGKTITFPTTVTAFVIEYLPRSAADVTAAF